MRMTMNSNGWTLALLSAGLISLPAIAQAEENTNAIPALLTSLSTTTLSGYVDTSAVWNPGTGNQNLPPYTPNGAAGGTKADGFNLNVVALTLTKAPDADAWSAGYNVTMLFGPDAVGYNSSFGSATGEFSLKDTYVELHARIGNGLDVKIGTWTEILGYEVYETAGNPNYTRSYGYGIEPTAMTGVLAAYQFSPVVSPNAGIANTWSAGVNSRAFQPQGTKAESYKTYLGSVTLTAPESLGFLSGSTLSGGVINGYNDGRAAVETSFYVGGTIKTPCKSLSIGLAYDYAALSQNTVNDIAYGSGYQNASALYLLWQAADKLSFNTRGDYFTQSSYLASPGLPHSAFALTETAQYDLWKNIVSRVEFRWDHSTDDSAPYSTGRDNAFMVAANIIYKF